MNAAYEQGQEANENGEFRNANPMTDPQMRVQWFAGWDALQVVREEWEHGNYERCKLYA